MSEERKRILDLGRLQRWPERTSKERFYDKIFYSPDGCHYWTGSINESGYGSFGIETKPVKTIGSHRASYIFNKGPIPDGLHVLHKCDNRMCVNPDHLFLGTNYDNVQDAIRKGRTKHKNSKLNPDKVMYIRASDHSVKELAIKFGVSTSAIRLIKNNVIWKHVK